MPNDTSNKTDLTKARYTLPVYTGVQNDTHIYRPYIYGPYIRVKKVAHIYGPYKWAVYTGSVYWA